MKKIEFFKVEGDKINRVRRHCPKCGPGVFLGEHKNRFSCGRCGYTEFKSAGKKEVKPSKVDEKPVAEQVEKPESSSAPGETESKEEKPADEESKLKETKDETEPGESVSSSDESVNEEKIQDSDVEKP